MSCKLLSHMNNNSSTSRVKKVKGWVVEWFGYIQPVGRVGENLLPTLYRTRKEARTAYGDEKIKTVRALITYEVKK